MVAQIDEEGEKGKDMYLQAKAVRSCKNKFSYNCCGCSKMAMHGNSLFRKTGEKKCTTLAHVSVSDNINRNTIGNQLRLARVALPSPRNPTAYHK